MQHRICICGILPKIENHTKLVLIIHNREVRKPTNSGGLAARCLQNSAVYVRGAIGHLVPYDDILAAPEKKLLLFPDPDAQPLTPEFCASLTGPLNLIVPDGNWRQASVVRSKLPEDQIQVVRLPPGEFTRYQLRREARERPEGLATLEAIARAYHALEGPHVSEPLMDIFDIFVQRTLWSRGQLRAEDVRGGIPPP